MSRARTWAAGAFSCLAAATAVLGLQAETADAQLYDAELVRDINPGTDTTFSPKNLAVMGGALYFTAGNATTGFELWRSDGTLNGTTLVKEFVSGSSGGVTSFLTAIVVVI
jgi:ELWxxDGT repeat protein